MDDTSGVMKTPVSSGFSVARTTAVSVGIVLGIFTSFIIAVCLVIIIRRRRYLGPSLWVLILLVAIQ